MKITSCMQSGKSNNFYEILSLRSEDINNVGINDIKRAYRCMALQYHPDVCHDHSNKEESTRRFIELQKAYETLSDPILRENYDYQLSLRDSSENSSRIVHKDVWERQLNELRRRSLHRMEKKRSI
uniref:Chaperone protein DNAj n=1 Tax=Solanum tuberosum TaxID=4113 RepID=M1DXX4_SOLTU